jgi:hypothetical protein
MQTETAKLLTEAIATATNLALDNQNKFVALENALQEHDQSLFQIYLKFLDEIRRDPPTLLFSEVFVKLQSELAQD